MSNTKYSLITISIIGILLFSMYSAFLKVSDHTKIVFESCEDENWEVFVMDVCLCNAVNITMTPNYDETLPVWSPDGRKVAFSLNNEIYVMNADGGRKTRLTYDRAGGFYPAWSPDGKKIAFSLESDIYVMNADGSNRTALTKSSGHDDEPAWSPDGTKIAFVRRIGTNEDIYIMDVDGSHQINLTNNPASDQRPAWSPDGKKIIFVSYRDENGEIYIMGADGSHQINLTNNIAGDRDPAWTPDGMILFTSMRKGDPDREIYIMNPDGSNQRRLCSNSIQASRLNCVSLSFTERTFLILPEIVVMMALLTLILVTVSLYRHKRPR